MFRSKRHNHKQSLQRSYFLRGHAETNRNHEVSYCVRKPKCNLICLAIFLSAANFVADDDFIGFLLVDYQPNEFARRHHFIIDIA